MSYFTCEGRLNFLSSEQKTQLSQRFRSAREGIMPHQLAVSVGLKYAEALAILTVLEADGVCRNQLLIYHVCEPEIPADSIPYGTGFPKLPWACPSCGEVVEFKPVNSGLRTWNFSLATATFLPETRNFPLETGTLSFQAGSF